MKYYRVAAPQPCWAREEGEGEEEAGRLRLLDGTPFDGVRDRSETIAFEDVALLPATQPSKIVIVGLNYRDHAAERGRPCPEEPILFLKPPSAVVGPGDAIRRPTWVGRVEHEAELGIVIGKVAHDLASPEEASHYILGATCVNDVTARELCDARAQFTRAKAFDTFCPIGPCIATGLNLGDLQVQGRCNGELRQSSRTSQLIFDVNYLVWFIARVMTLFPGDIIATGTPSGVGSLEDGDVFEVEVEGVGVLRNVVSDADHRGRGARMEATGEQRSQRS